MIVHPKLQTGALKTLHAAHQGTTGLTKEATACVFWPEITKDLPHNRLKNLIDSYRLFIKFIACI